MLRQVKEIDQARNGVVIVIEPVSDEKLLQLKKRYEVIIFDDI